jgi:hypothetical protein
MAFVLNKKATYFWPIRITLAADDGGQRTVETLDLEFRRLAQSRIDAIVKQAKNAERSRDEDDELRDQEICKELVAGWRNVKNDAGDELLFSDAAFTMFLEIQTVPGQVLKAWFDSLRDGKRKN